MQEGADSDTMQGLPWFGALRGLALLAPFTSPQETEAVAVLSEGGQLMVYDAASWQPRPLAVTFQSLEPATCTLCCAAAAEGALLTLSALRVGCPGSLAALVCLTPRQAYLVLPWAGQQPSAGWPFRCLSCGVHL